MGQRPKTQGFPEQVIIDPVDLYVKQRVVTDAIKIALTKSDNPQLNLPESGSLNLILPNKDVHDVFETSELLKDIFFTLRSIKTPELMSSSDFEKLASREYLSKELGF